MIETTNAILAIFGGLVGLVTVASISWCFFIGPSIERILEGKRERRLRL